MIPFRKILFARRAGRLANDLCVDQPAVLVLAQQGPASSNRTSPWSSA